MLDLETVSKLAESAKTDKTDIPQGSTVLRIEPIVTGPVWVVVILRIYWPDGTDYGAASMLKVTEKNSPKYELAFSQSLDGAKVIAQAFLPDGAVPVAVRVTSADSSDKIPARKLTKLTKGA